MPLYCGRPKNFTDLIGNNLKEVGFKNDDVLIHPGDICMGHEEEAHDLYIKPLRCKKWLVRGNHDNKSDNWYLSHGWDFICHKFQSKYFGKTIMFSHMPQAYTRPVDIFYETGAYDFNIHGHFHNSDHRRCEPELMAIRNDKQKLLAIEYPDYKPVLLEDFIIGAK